MPPASLPATTAGTVVPSREHELPVLTDPANKTSVTDAAVYAGVVVPTSTCTTSAGTESTVVPLEKSHRSRKRRLEAVTYYPARDSADGPDFGDERRLPGSVAALGRVRSRSGARRKRRRT